MAQPRRSVKKSGESKKSGETKKSGARKKSGEIAGAKLPSGDGKSSAAVERIRGKESEREEIRFSSWSGTRMMPRALALPEAELLPLLDAAIKGGVFSPDFVEGLRGLLPGPAAASPAPPPPASPLGQIQGHFHALIRARAGERLGDRAASLPLLTRDGPSEKDPGWFPVEGMGGGFKYWWDATAQGPRLISESSSRTAPGSGQLHEITPNGANLLGEGFD